MDFQATQIIEDDCDGQNSQSFNSSQNSNEKIQIATLEIAGQKHPIFKGLTKIGRHPACEICLNDITVSKMHAEIEATKKSAFISDLQSSNKTRMNSEILRASRFYELHDGARLQFGFITGLFMFVRSKDDSLLVPETPVPCLKLRKENLPANLSFLSSRLDSSAEQSDGSIILGTQENDANIFRLPNIPAPHRPSLKLLQTSIHDLQTQPYETSSANNSSNLNDSSLYDIPTQNFDEKSLINKTSVCDDETQEFDETKNDKDSQISENKKDSIHDIETQLYDNQPSTSKKVDIQDLDTQIFNNPVSVPENTSIHDVTTQIFDVSNVEKDADKSKNEDIDKICDLETQKCEHDSNVPQVSEANEEKIKIPEQSKSLSIVEPQINEIVDNCPKDNNNELNVILKKQISNSNVTRQEENNESDRSMSGSPDLLQNHEISLRHSDEESSKILMSKNIINDSDESEADNECSSSKIFVINDCEKKQDSFKNGEKSKFNRERHSKQFSDSDTDEDDIFSKLPRRPSQIRRKSRTSSMENRNSYEKINKSLKDIKKSSKDFDSDLTDDEKYQKILSSRSRKECDEKNLNATENAKSELIVVEKTSSKASKVDDSDVTDEEGFFDARAFTSPQKSISKSSNPPSTIKESKPTEENSNTIIVIKEVETIQDVANGVASPASEIKQSYVIDESEELESDEEMINNEKYENTNETVDSKVNDNKMPAKDSETDEEGLFVLGLSKQSFERREREKQISKDTGDLLKKMNPTENVDVEYDSSEAPTQKILPKDFKKIDEMKPTQKVDLLEVRPVISPKHPDDSDDDMTPTQKIVVPTNLRGSGFPQHPSKAKEDMEPTQIIHFPEVRSSISPKNPEDSDDDMTPTQKIVVPTNRRGSGFPQLASKAKEDMEPIQIIHFPEVRSSISPKNPEDSDDDMTPTQKIVVPTNRRGSGFPQHPSKAKEDMEPTQIIHFPEVRSSISPKNPEDSDDDMTPTQKIVVPTNRRGFGFPQHPSKAKEVMEPIQIIHFPEVRSSISPKNPEDSDDDMTPTQKIVVPTNRRGSGFPQLASKAKEDMEPIQIIHFPEVRSSISPKNPEDSDDDMTPTQKIVVPTNRRGSGFPQHPSKAKEDMGPTQIIHFPEVRSSISPKNLEDSDDDMTPTQKIVVPTNRCGSGFPQLASKAMEDMEPTQIIDLSKVEPVISPKQPEDSDDDMAPTQKIVVPTNRRGLKFSKKPEKSSDQNESRIPEDSEDRVESTRVINRPDNLKSPISHTSTKYDDFDDTSPTLTIDIVQEKAKVLKNSDKPTEIDDKVPKQILPPKKQHKLKNMALNMPESRNLDISKISQTNVTEITENSTAIKSRTYISESSTAASTEDSEHSNSRSKLEKTKNQSPLKDAKKIATSTPFPNSAKKRKFNLSLQQTEFDNKDDSYRETKNSPNASKNIQNSSDLEDSISKNLESIFGEIGTNDISNMKVTEIAVTQQLEDILQPTQELVKDDSKLLTDNQVQKETKTSENLDKKPQKIKKSKNVKAKDVKEDCKKIENFFSNSSDVPQPKETSKCADLKKGLPKVVAPKLALKETNSLKTRKKKAKEVPENLLDESEPNKPEVVVRKSSRNLKKVKYESQKKSVANLSKKRKKNTTELLDSEDENQEVEMLMAKQTEEAKSDTNNIDQNLVYKRGTSGFFNGIAVVSDESVPLLKSPKSKRRKIEEKEISEPVKVGRRPKATEVTKKKR